MPPAIRLHQFHAGSAPAVAASMAFVHSILDGWGVLSHSFAEPLDPRFAEAARPLETIAVGPGDLLLIHHADGAELPARLAALPCRKALVYHGIAPPRLFAEGDPRRARSVNGYVRLGDLRAMIEAAIAISEFTAGQLRERGFANVATIPLLKDFAAWRAAPHAKRPYYDASPVFRLLCAGPTRPGDGRRELIDFVAATGALDGVPLELVLADDGAAAADDIARLRERVRRLGLEPRVRILQGIGDEELAGWYRASTAYVALSEYQEAGALLAAMAFDLPVVACSSPQVAAILGGAGLLLAEGEPAALREALARLARDRPFRRELIRRQRGRLQRFSRERIAGELADWLAGLGLPRFSAAPAAPCEADEGAAGRSRVDYVIEGPFETSYSLASVVRNLALSLDARPGCRGRIEPAEGDEGWTVDAEAEARLPRAFRELVRPPPPTAAPIVTIRNMFPLRPNGMLGDMRLVHLAWEESAIAPDLAAMINFHLDGVLAPSAYCKALIRNSGVRLPIAVIGHGIDHAGLVPPAPVDRAARGRPGPRDPFVFLHISAGVDRKGVEELVTAYCMAFSARDPVLLVIKTFDNEQNQTDFWVERLTGAAEAAPALQVVKDELHPQELELLYRRADAVVLPARGEGFNFPAAEGLARALPVILTRHSGHLDFCNDGNSLLIDCRLELSSSYLGIPNSVWARASVPHLIALMKTAYNEARIRGTPTHRRAQRGPQDAAGLRWSAVAERVDAFARSLATRPVMTRKLKLAWISPYNSRAGIAEYSQHLIEPLDREAFDLTILAADEPPLRVDADNVERVWRLHDGNLTGLCHRLLAGGFDAAFFQHSFDLFASDAFAAALQAAQRAGIDTYVTLHRTRDEPGADRQAGLGAIVAALAGCTRIFVHAVDDMNRLKEHGITDSVVLLPHGVIDSPPLSLSAARVLLGLERFAPVVGTFGFLFPHKGLQNLICAFALLLRRHPGAFLVMANARFADAKSQEEHARCAALIEELGLAGRVRLIGEFLDNEEVLLLLSACDVVVYPYQETQEAASGAVRLALAAGRPVAVTPLPIFADLSDIVHRLPGTGTLDIAEGLGALLADRQARDELVERQRRWVAVNSWAAQAGRIADILRGCFEERRGVALGAPAASAPSAAAREEEARGGLRAADLAAAEALLKRRAATPAEAAPETVAAPDSPPPLPPLFDRIGSRLPGPLRRQAQRRWVRRARRARAARDWPLAALHYRLALRHAPERPGLWVQYGHALKESGHFTAAEEAYRRSIALAPEVADTHLQLGHLLKIQGAAGAAAAAYLRALALDRGLAPARAELSALGWTAGRIERALSRPPGEGP